MSPERGANPRRKPVQRRSAETVDAVVEAAAQVFERHGYAAGTTNRIAARAGVSIGTLYQYFPDKDAILVALIERHLDEAAALLLPLMVELTSAPPPVAEGVDRILRALLELHRHQPTLHRVLFEEAPRPEALRQRLDETANLAAAAITAYLAARPEVTVGDLPLAAQLVAQTAESVTHGLVIHPRDEQSPEAYAAETVTLLTRYLTG